MPEYGDCPSGLTFPHTTLHGFGQQWLQDPVYYLKQGYPTVTAALYTPAY